MPGKSTHVHMEDRTHTFPWSDFKGRLGLYRGPGPESGPDVFGLSGREPEIPFFSLSGPGPEFFIFPRPGPKKIIQF